MLHGLGDAKICQLEDSLVIDKYILRLDIPMYNFVGVQIEESLDKLNKPVHNELFFKKVIALFIFLDIDRKISI